MKISELIKELKRVQKANGDQEIAIFAGDEQYPVIELYEDDVELFICGYEEESLKKVEITFENLRGDLSSMVFELTEEEYKEVEWGELPEKVMKGWRKEHKKAQINDWAACDYETCEDIRGWRYA